MWVTHKISQKAEKPAKNRQFHGDKLAMGGSRLAFVASRMQMLHSRIGIRRARLHYKRQKSAIRKLMMGNQDHQQG